MSAYERIYGRTRQVRDFSAAAVHRVLGESVSRATTSKSSFRNIRQFAPRPVCRTSGRFMSTMCPDKWCLELKSLKEYVNAYRNLGIFYENAVNRILQDLVAACKPVSMKVRGEFTPRGGIQSRIEARYTSFIAHEINRD